MKRNNVAKRCLITSLCLATVLSAVSGLASLKNEVALADGETVKATQLVHTNVAAEKVTQDENGLRISSDDAYTATFKEVFQGATTIRFKFPETYDETKGFYGDFRFTFTDATNDSNSFDVIYYVQNEGKHRTTPCVKWGDEVRMTDHTGGTLYNYQNTANTNFRFAPCFLTTSEFVPDTKGRDGTREGVLALAWQEDVLYVFSLSNNTQGANYWVRIAAFDGTYDATQPDSNWYYNSKDAANKRWGLPKMNFASGYTISVASEFHAEGVADEGTDVLFTGISTNGTTTYDLSSVTNKTEPTFNLTYGATYDFKTTTDIAKDAYMTAFETGFDMLTAANAPAAQAGKVFLGWKNTDSNKLYPVTAVMQKDKYEACVIDYDTVTGASVRLSGRSGIRFQTMFDASQYASLVAGGNIVSYGTLVAQTEALTKGDFTIENYAGDAAFAQVKNNKGVFDYTKDDKAYKAYTVAVLDVEEANYTKAYSARGYLNLKYANGLTATFYTDYNATDNSRTIAGVAAAIKAKADKYDALSDAKKAIIDAYAAANN